MKAAGLPGSLSHCTLCTRHLRTYQLPQRLTKIATTSKAFSSSSKTAAEVVPDRHNSEIDELIDDIVPIQAAPEIKFTGDKGAGSQLGPDQLPDVNIRLVPASPSYFTGLSAFTDSLLHLQGILRRNATLPTVKPGEQPRVAWRDIVQYRNMVGETVPNAKYSKIVRLLQRLNLINPALMPAEVKAALEPYKRDINPFMNQAKPVVVDEHGRASAVGRRKASKAKAIVVEGTGEVLINGKTLTEQFARVHDRESVIWALKVTDRVDKYNIWGRCHGGGTTGQAEALALAISKALIIQEPLLKPALRRGMFKFLDMMYIQLTFSSRGCH